jgi:DNA-binding NtrC family response regulator/CHASE2 domain-containing sensor protein
MSLAAVSIAWSLWSLAPSAFTTLERGWYDTWLRERRPPEASPHLLLAVRDAESEQLFGSAPWDRAVIARLVSALHEAGAGAIGIDVPLTSPSPPTQGGAASDALLLEAARSAGSVVYPETGSFSLESQVPPPSVSDDTGQPAPAHMAATVDHDRVVRRIPLFAERGNRRIPAFALQLAAVFQHGQPGALHIPTDHTGNLLINFAGQGSVQAFQLMSFAELWRHLENKTDEQIEKRAKGKLVVLLTQPALSRSYATPFGVESSDELVQIHALDTILAGRWIHELPALPQFIVAVLLCLMVGWSVLTRQAPMGLAFALGGLAAYVAMVFVILAAARWILPLTVPVTAGALVILGGTILEQILSARRVALVEADMLRIQQELVSMREALVCRENAVEALEEDLDSARLSATSSASRQQELLRTAEELRLHMADAQQLEDAARRRVEELERELSAVRAAAIGPPPLGNAEQEQLRQECEQLGIIARHPGMLGVFRDLKKGARSGVTVLITGEAGTGKELFARAVHRLSPRSAKPFIAVNMAAISPELFESELFGHIRGSFTGALTDRKGYFELAHQGTIFLDEIGDLRLDHQSKLLRVLQDRTFYRVGATSPTTVDVRIVAATNKDLQRGVSEGWFREDLYFRLKGLVLHLAPLRDRPDDIPTLAGACLQEVSRHTARGKLDLSHEALATLQQQPWKGNVRELRQCLEQAAALCDGPIITTADLRLQSRLSATAPIAGTEPLLPDPAGDAAVLTMLRQHTFDMQTTAKTLGWDRSTVTQRLKGLCFQALVESGGDQTKAASSLAGDPSLLRTVELKLMDYYGHLMGTVRPFATVEEALVDCKRRFKNLPERHFKSVETLVRKHFAQKTEASIRLQKGPSA